MSRSVSTLPPGPGPVARTAFNSVRRHVSNGTIALAAGAVLIVAHLLIESRLPWWQRLMGTIPGLIALWAAADYFDRGQFDRLPFREYAAFQFYAYWGFPTLTYESGMRGTGASEESITAALVAIAIVSAGAVVAHPLGLWVGRRLAPFVQWTMPRSAPRNTRYLFWPWLILTVAVHAGWIPSVVPEEYRNAVNLLGSYVPLLVFAALDAGTGQLAPRARLATATGVLAVAGFFTGMMEAVLAPLLVSTLLFVMTRRRVPWRVAIVGALIIVVVNPAKHVYREIAWQRGEDHVEKDPTVAMRNWGEALGQTWLGGHSAVNENLDTIGGRFNELAYLAPTFELCPAFVGFRYGEDWGFIPLAVVPRALYPDKPDYTEIFNARYNITFGFQTEEMTKTSTSSFPLVADGYWNFGWPGVVLVGVLAGFIMGAYGGAYTPSTWGGLSLAALSFAGLHAQGHFARLAIGVLQQHSAVAVTCWGVWIVGLGFIRGRNHQRIRRSVCPGNADAPG